MIIVSLYEDFDVDYLGRQLLMSPKVLWVSHGIDYDSLQTIGLPTERWSDFKKHCWFYSAIGEWGCNMKVKDVLKFAGGIDHARGLLARMKSYIDSKPPLKNCWYSKGGSDEKFIHPYKSTYSISYKHLKEVIAEYDKTKTT